jgi:hypothetical protein
MGPALRGAGLGGNGGMGMIAALWSAMVSGLMACAAVLAEINLDASRPVTKDAWKQY